MSDLFRLIRRDVERTKPKKDMQSNLDGLLLGEEENQYKQKAEQRKNIPVEDDVFDKEIGFEKERIDRLSDVEKLNMQKLNKKPIKTQNQELKTEYLNIYDRAEELNYDLERKQKQINDMQLEKHSINKEIAKLRTFIRNIAYMLPGGTEIKQKLEASGWRIQDIQEAYIKHVGLLVDRLKKIDAVIEEETKKTSHENKLLKKKMTQFEAMLLKLEEEMEAQASEAPVFEKSNSSQSKNEVKSSAPSKDGKEEDSNSEDQSIFTAESKINSSDSTTAEEVKQKPVEKAKSLSARLEEMKGDFDEEEDLSAGDEEDVDDSYEIINIERYLENLSDSKKYIIEVIGATGISRNSELREHIENDKEVGSQIYVKGNKFKNQDMSSDVKALRDGQFLEDEKIKLGGRGGHNFLVYELSDIGKAAYKKITGKKPVISEKRVIVKQHASLEHGYLIKDSARSFSQQGYTVYTEREDVSVKLPEGKRKDFDFVIEKDGKKSYIEVERGTHSNEDFFDAMDKIFKITGEFYFIAPNEEVLYGKTKRQFFMWITERQNGMENVKGKITVNFAKFEDIKKMKKEPWETMPL